MMDQRFGIPQDLHRGYGCLHPRAEARAGMGVANASHPAWSCTTLQFALEIGLHVEELEPQHLHVDGDRM